MKFLKVSKLFIFTLLLVACSSVEYPAEEAMLEDRIYTSQGSPSIILHFIDNELTSQVEDSSLKVEEYGEYTLQTKKDQFILTFEDDTEMIFKRVGERLIEDENGVVFAPN